MKLAIAFALAAYAHGHASMIMPPSRNSIDVDDPQYSAGKRPATGWIEPYRCTCGNGTSPCNNAQSCFWFSQGCTPGCKACDGNGSRIPNFDHCPGTSLNHTDPGYICDPKYRTGNIDAPCGSHQDFSKYNPWRAPGRAPVFDACGMAGGVSTEAFNAGAYHTTKFAKQGDLGSAVLKYRPSGTVWKRGKTAKTRWQLTAAHGGGYQYRLCPLSKFTTDGQANEKCFQSMPLEFAKPHRHTIRYSNKNRTEENDFDTNATVIPAGEPGAGWAIFPLPYSSGAACDYNVNGPYGNGSHCDYKCPGCNGGKDPVTGQPTYAADGACPTPCGRYPGLPNSTRFSTPTTVAMSKHGSHGAVAIEDTLVVPAKIPPGEYVLGYRWDCEWTSQVWTQCSDITIE